MVFDPSNDYLYFDNLQTITYYVRVSEDTFGGTFDSDFDSDFSTPITINNTIEIQDYRDNVAGSDLAQMKTTIHIWANEINFVPKRSDGWVDGNGNTWIVEKVDYTQLINKYQLYCYESNHGLGA